MIVILLVEYDGTNYSGWQIQPGTDTIQQRLQDAASVIAGKDVKLIGSGRTDSGVHASGQVAHFEIDESFTVPEEKIAKAINSRLPDDIRVIEAEIYHQDFHSRFDAVKRAYSYDLITAPSVFKRRFASYYRYPLIEKKLLGTSGLFELKSDFTTFSKYNPDIKNNVCIVDICKWEKVEENHYRLKIRSNHFLYGMVRSLAGAMIEAARGKYSHSELLGMLEKKDRSLAPPLAPPQGLVLADVYYPLEMGLIKINKV